MKQPLGGGIGTTETLINGAYIRYRNSGIAQTSYTPVLSCKNENDNLKLPVGLITADKYALAEFMGFIAYSGGYLGHGGNVNLKRDVRPVINLNSTTTFTNNGTGAPGTSINSYEVVVN